MPDAYKVMLDAELRKAFDVWSGYLDAQTGEDLQGRAELRSMLESAHAAATENEYAIARSWIATHSGNDLSDPS